MKDKKMSYIDRINGKCRCGVNRCQKKSKSHKIRMYAKGLKHWRPASEIAKRFDCSLATVYHALPEWGRKNHSPQKYEAIELNELRKLPLKAIREMMRSYNGLSSIIITDGTSGTYGNEIKYLRYQGRLLQQAAREKLLGLGSKLV